MNPTQKLNADLNRVEPLSTPSLSPEIKKPSELEMKTRVDEATVNALKNLSRLSEDELFDKRKLQASLEAELKSILMLDINKITAIYKQSNSAEKANLEKIFELLNAKSDGEKVRQREINAAIDLSKLEQEHLVNDLIQERYNEGKYQEAIDIAVVSAQKNPIAGFAYVRAVLQAMKRSGSTETLMIKDKRITPSQRDRRVSKMEDNMENAAREFKEHYYSDLNIKKTWEFDLDTTKKTKEISEKKALKLKDKELAGIVKHLNFASAFSIIEANYGELKRDTIGNEGALDKKLTEDYLLEKGYIPKDGKKINKRELTAIKNLFLFKRNYQKNEQANNGKADAYEAMKTAALTGVAMNQEYQAKAILDQIDITNYTTEDAENTLMVLLGDQNWDGQIRNISAINRQRKNIDQGVLFGGQIARIYKRLLLQNGEEKVVGNIEAIIQQLHGLEAFTIEPKSQKALLTAFKENPIALLAFRKKLLGEPDAGMVMLSKGTDYYQVKEERIQNLHDDQQRLEKIMKENEPLIEQYDEKLKDDQRLGLDTIQKNIKKMIKSPDFTNLKSEQQQSLKELDAQLATAGEIDKILESEAMQNLRKDAIHKSFGLAFSAIQHDGEMNIGAGAGVSLSSEQINEAIQKTKVFDNFSLGAGLYLNKSGFTLGLGSHLGGNKSINQDTRVFYGVSTGWSPFNPTAIGANVYGGLETQTNRKNIEASLTRKAAEYVGFIGSAGGALNLANSGFNVAAFSGQVFLRKDKLEGIEQKTDSIAKNLIPIFKELFGANIVETSNQALNNYMGWNLDINKITPDTIAVKLWEKFPESRGEDVYQVAQGMYRMLNSYKNVSTNVIGDLSADFANYIAQNARNQDIEAIAKEGWHISQLGVGVTVSLMRFFTGYFGTGSLVLTDYADTRYEENKGSLERAVDGLFDARNFSVTNKAKNLEEKVAIVNRLLKKNDALEFKAQKKLENQEVKYLSLNPSTFKEGIRVYCHPDLAPYIAQDRGEIKLPHNADIALGTILHQGMESHTLILGASSAAGCKEIVLNDKGGLESKDQNQQLAFGGKSLEEYRLENKEVLETAEVTLEKKPQQELVDFLEKNGDELVNFRSFNKNYPKFIQLMKSPNARSLNLDAAIALLPDSLKAIKDNKGLNVDDIRFIYASLSRVSQTRDKQLEGDGFSTKANEYLKAIKLNPDQKKQLEAYIEKVASGTALSDEEWKAMQSMLRVQGAWHKNFANTPELKLFHLLTPVKKLAEARTEAYNSRMVKEYLNSMGIPSLIAARSKSINALTEKPTAQGKLKEGWIGAVAGYDLVDQIDDKFVGAPKLIDGSEVPIEGQGLPVIKQHFLTELARDDQEQFAYFKGQIITQLAASSLVADKDLAKNWKNLDSSAFIEALLSDEGLKKVNFDMQYGFFADCVNETILLGDVKVNIQKTEQAPAPSEVYHYGATIINDAVTIDKNLGIGIVVGGTEKKDDSGTDPEKKPDDQKEPETNDKSATNPTKKITLTDEQFEDLVAQGKLKEVEGNYITIDGVKYNLYFDEETSQWGGYTSNINDLKQIHFGIDKEGKIYTGFKEHPADFPKTNPSTPTPVDPLPPAKEEVNKTNEAVVTTNQLITASSGIGNSREKTKQNKK